MLYLGIGGYLVDKGNLSGFIDLADKFSNKLSVEHHDRKSIVQSVNLYNSLIDIQKNKFENKEKIKSQIDETFIKNSNFMMNDSFDKSISRIFKENDGLNDSQLTFNESEISLSKSFENETLKSLKLFNNDDTNIFKDESITIDEKGKIEIMKMEIKLLKDDFEIQKQFYINEIKHLNTLVDQFKRKNQEFSNENNLLKKKLKKSFEFLRNQNEDILKNRNFSYLKTDEKKIKKNSENKIIKDNFHIILKDSSSLKNKQKLSANIIGLDLDKMSKNTFDNIFDIYNDKKKSSFFKKKSQKTCNLEISDIIKKDQVTLFEIICFDIFF